MNIKKEKYCSVCFRAPENGYEVIDSATSIMLHVLTIELNADSSEELFLCQECAEIVKKSYDFKLISSDRINRYWVKRNGLRSRHRTANSKSTETDILKEYTTCTLCTSQVKSDKVLSTSILLNDPNIMEFYSRCMADIELEDIKAVMICISCKENFEAYFNFVRNYLDVKEKINVCFKNETFINGNTNQLRNIHNFLARTTTESSHVSTEISEIKQELCKFKDNKQLKAPCESLKNEEMDIKDETIVVNTEDQESQENVSESTISNLQTQSDNLGLISSSPDVKMYKCDSRPCETKEGNYIKIHTLVQDSEKIMYKCKCCPFKLKWQGPLKNRMLVHNFSSEMKFYKCSSCRFQTKWKFQFDSHMTRHTKIYKCDVCTYESKRKDTLRRHSLTHKEYKVVYKPAICTYETESQICQCVSCTYESKPKEGLENHTLSHKDPSERNTYKCNSCTYETHCKNALIKHQLIHTTIPGVEKYKCASCTYETTYKQSLVKHFLTHKSKSEVEMYKCDSCTYETKHKSNLKTHKLTHKDISEVKMYKCHNCAYEAKQKFSLMRHMSTHNKVSDLSNVGNTVTSSITNI